MRVIKVDLNGDYREAISEVVAVLNSGGVVIYPTDTIYALGANAMNLRGVERIFRIKKRSLAKPLPIFAKNTIWVNELANVNPKIENVLGKIWPGKVTAVLPKKSIVPNMITAQSQTVGIRIPDYLFIDKLLGRFGYPITATSANISGLEGTGNINEIIETFGKALWKLGKIEEEYCERKI